MSKKKQQEVELFPLDTFVFCKYEEYEAFKKDLKKIILEDFMNIKQLPVILEVGENQYECTYGNFLTYLILLRPFAKYRISFPEEILCVLDGISDINAYFDTIIRFFKENHNILIYDDLIETVSELSALSAEILGVYGVTINLYDITKLMRTNQEFYDLISFKLKDLGNSIEFESATKLLSEKMGRMLEILKSTDNCYNVLLQSKAGVNDRQLKECLLLVGFKPDEEGYIIPEPVDSSYIEGQSPFEFLIDAVGGCKALCINYKNTKKSGYLTRKLSEMTLDNYISLDIDDCGSIHTLETVINNQMTLDKLIYRNYVDENEDIHMIDPEMDTHLIGTTINLRSPCKCACSHGTICKTCYGGLWRYNIDKNVGIIGSLILTNQNTQLQLSAKHSLQASPDKIDWGEDFLQYFTVNKDQILLNVENDTKFNIVIPEFNDNEEIYDDSYTFDTFIISDGKNDICKIISPKSLLINEDIIDIESCYSGSKDQYIINCKDYEDTDVLFVYMMENNELVASLNSIIQLIETHAFIKDNPIDAVYNRFIMLLNDSPLIVHYVHIEIILKELCVIRDNNRSLFSTSEESPITDILRVTDALVKNCAVAKSLAYQEQFKQLTQMTETYNKDEISILDQLLI